MPPESPRGDVVETIGGLTIADPYRWLEDGLSPGTRSWVDQQNGRTRRILDALPRRGELLTRLRGLLAVDTSLGPRVAGDTVFSLDRWDEHDQHLLVVRHLDAHPTAEPEVLVDPRLVVDDPTAAIDWFEPSWDGRLVAVGISTGGDEQSTLRVLDAAAGSWLADEIPRTRAAAVAWEPAGAGFAYTRYPAPGTVPDDELGYHRIVHHHELGTDPDDDPVVWDRLPDETAWPQVAGSRDGRWLVVHVSLGWSRVDVHLLDRERGLWTTVVEGVEAATALEIVGDHLVGTTTLDADRGRVVAAPLDSPRPASWVTLVGESDAVVEATACSSASLFVLSTRSAVSELTVSALDGTGRRGLELPELGSLAGLSADREADRVFFSFTSFTRPPTLYEWAPAEGLRRWGRPAADVDPDRYAVSQHRYVSTDGTDIPVFLVERRDLEAGTAAPTILTAYGGFAITMGPAYSPAIVSWCDDGGRYAVAGIRGGSEEGEAWHRAGMGRHKQQVFDDFCAAGDWLVSTGRTTRDELAIRGGSNGGLLVGAALTQRPDLCRAVHCAVPLLDMVRYHRFGIARLWIPEYGDPDDPDELAWLHAYSPYHRVADGTCYPAVLLTTGEEDSRVDPLHARKMAARLQEASSCQVERPILLRLETRAGHGQGKPVTKQADELADVLAFLDWQLAPSLR